MKNNASLSKFDSLETNELGSIEGGIGILFFYKK